MTGEHHSVKDRPQFDADDTTTSYSPPRADRPRWMEPGWGGGAPANGQPASAASNGGVVRPQHWFDPTTATTPVPSPPPAPTRPAPRAAGPGRGSLVAGGAAIAVVAAALASGGTYGLLAVGGYLDRGVAALPTPVTGATTPMPHAQTVHIEQSDLTDAVAAVSPAVVTITSSTTTPTDALDGESTGVGSGVIYDADGSVAWVLTNRHVVCGPGTLVIQLADGRQFSGHTYGVDTLTDLAIVEVDAASLPSATVGDSSALRPGQISLAIGSSLGTLTTSVTSGVVSALGRDVVVDDACGGGASRSLRNLIQTDAAINPGNSGGALIDSSGELIGINTAVAGGAQGIGFAIPINIAKPIMEQAVAGKPLTRPWLGITFVPLNAGIAQERGLPIDHGVLVAASPDGTQPGVIPGSPAEAAGIQDGDIITAIDDQRIDSSHPLDDILAQYRPAAQDPLAISILRDGAPVTVKLFLGTRPAQQS